MFSDIRKSLCSLGLERHDGAAYSDGISISSMPQDEVESQTHQKLVVFKHFSFRDTGLFVHAQSADWRSSDHPPAFENVRQEYCEE
jgi:hypothetical protein